jgi:hypothetical protein
MNYSGTGYHMGPTVLGITGEHKREKKQKKKKRGRGQRAGFAQFGTLHYLPYYAVGHGMSKSHPTSLLPPTQIAAAAADAKRSSCRGCCLDLSRVYGFNWVV